MPLVPFANLPDDARVWVFASPDPIPDDLARVLLQQVDAYLADWHAHGVPLICAREWREGRFLVIAVDQSTAAASGCSIDALFRVLRSFGTNSGISLLGSGAVYYRDSEGRVRGVDRREFAKLVSLGELDPATPVFDTAVTTAGDYRAAFERSLAQSWHKRLAELAASSS
jgi:hypothetical protein